MAESRIRLTVEELRFLNNFGVRLALAVHQLADLRLEYNAVMQRIMDPKRRD